jgi:NAD(P)-dependent dehydrogenase (short-subunit alcohol dehydrogenase family)
VLTPGFTVQGYRAAKAGVIVFSKAIAVDLATALSPV